MKKSDVERIEVEMLLECLCERYGYDFRSYSREHVARRVRGFVEQGPFVRISDLIPAVLWDEDLAAQLIRRFSITVTSLFRDPEFYAQVRKHVIPVLRTYPFFKIWHAGCATGEEVYSMAILLEEEGLAGRATIYGTDFNNGALDRARRGVYDAARAREFADNYIRAGGQKSFSDYAHARYGFLALSAQLKENILFANHNLVTDGVFGEVHVVFCRNVLIYFRPALQKRALGLFSESLVRGGFLCVGAREPLDPDAEVAGFGAVAPGAAIYRSNAGADRAQDRRDMV